MPYKDPDKARENARERTARYRAAHPDKVRESQRKYHANMSGEAKGRRDERQKRYQKANREKIRAQARERYARNPRSRDKTREQHLWARHRMTQADYQAMRDAQGGRCCYCNRPLPDNQRAVHVDHDHTCTCGPKFTCELCRRGVACEACNIIIGKAGDDPDRLEVIATNLRRLAAAARQRITAKPVQGELPLNVLPLECREDTG